jgi:hypothetical protein
LGVGGVGHFGFLPAHRGRERLEVELAGDRDDTHSERAVHFGDQGFEYPFRVQSECFDRFQSVGVVPWIMFVGVQCVPYSVLRQQRGCRWALTRHSWEHTRIVIRAGE